MNVSHTQECINFEVKIKDFEFNLECIVNESSFLTAVLGDFNGILKGRYKNDITTFEGCKIDTTTFQSGLHKIIKEPT